MRWLSMKHPQLPSDFGNINERIFQSEPLVISPVRPKDDNQFSLGQV